MLLHGLARTRRSMMPMQRALERRGYLACNPGYQWRHGSIEEIARQVIGAALQRCSGNSPVHFVTHSLGGILLRQYHAECRIANLGRVVMLGPPNHGSEVVDRLRGYSWFRWFYGVSGLQLGTDAASLPRRLGPARFDLGVIAGTRSPNPLLSRLFEGRNDGRVSVASTRLEGMRDHLEMAVTHMFIMRNRAVIEQTIHYLEHGRFEHTG